MDQANKGVQSTSGYLARMGGGGMMNFGRVGGYTNLYFQFTYTFTTPNVGTYANHFHLDTVLYFEMDMDGTVIIRPSDSSTGLAWTNGPAFEKENIWHLHTFNSSWHSGVGEVWSVASEQCATVPTTP